MNCLLDALMMLQPHDLAGRWIHPFNLAGSTVLDSQYDKIVAEIFPLVVTHKPLNQGQIVCAKLWPVSIKGETMGQFMQYGQSVSCWPWQVHVAYVVITPTTRIWTTSAVMNGNPTDPRISVPEPDCGEDGCHPFPDFGKGQVFVVAEP
jgi:hypothetical protein